MATATIAPTELQGLPSHIGQAIKDLQAERDHLEKRIAQVDATAATYQFQLQNQIDALRSENQLLKSELSTLRSLGSHVKAIVTIAGDLNG